MPGAIEAFAGAIEIDDKVGTLKLAALLATPLTTTATPPEVAAAGTATEILFAVQAVGTATIPLKVSMLLPWLDPKLAPEIVIRVPGRPEFGDKLAIEGAFWGIVNGTPLLDTLL